MTANPEVSIIIPVYNEELNLPEMVARSVKACDQLPQSYEILLVDDGSSDKFAELIAQAVKDHPGKIVGVLLTRSKSWVVSFIGYNLLVIPLGFVISLYVSGYDPLLLATVFFETAAVTLLMMLLSMIFPRLFLSIGRALLISLLIVIVVELIATVIFVATGSGRESFFFLDWIVVLIFCGYVGYDWAIAQRRQRTVDAAVDSACALYLDIINVFIRLLSIASRRNRR